MVRVKISTHIRLVGDTKEEVKKAIEKYEADGFLPTLDIREVKNFDEISFFSAGMIGNIEECSI
jgi:hypothetical protein